MLLIESFSCFAFFIDLFPFEKDAKMPLSIRETDGEEAFFTMKKAPPNLQRRCLYPFFGRQRSPSIWTQAKFPWLVSGCCHKNYRDSFSFSFCLPPFFPNLYLFLSRTCGYSNIDMLSMSRKFFYFCITFLLQ